MKSKKIWSPEEDRIIREYYPQEGKKVAQRLSGRTETACMLRASLLGVSIGKTAKKWTTEEDDILREYYAQEDKAVAKRLPGRTENACGARARFLGFTKSAGKWTKEENEILRNFIPLRGCMSVIDFLEERLRGAGHRWPN